MPRGELATTVLRIPGYLWSLPYGLLALLGAGIFWACGWVVAGGWRDGQLELVCRGPLVDWITRPRPMEQEGYIRVWGGFTPAWVIFFWSVPDPAMRAHEQRHVQQVLWLGPLYWPVYLVLLAIYGYRDHPLERDARRWADEA